MANFLPIDSTKLLMSKITNWVLSSKFEALEGLFEFCKKKKNDQRNHRYVPGGKPYKA